MIFAVWIRRHLKESPVFEQRADVVDGVALSKQGNRRRRRACTHQHHRSSTAPAQGQASLIALGLRFGQAGNSGLVQTFLVGYLATVLLVDNSVGTTAIMYGSLLGFLTIPVMGLLGDRFGRRPLYLILTRSPHCSPSHDADGHQRQHHAHHHRHGHRTEPRCPEPLLHGKRHHGRVLRARTRFTQLALAKEIGGILATAIGPLLAATPPRSPATGGRSPRCSSATP